MKSNRNLSTDIVRLLRYLLRTKGAKDGERIRIVAGAAPNSSVAELSSLFQLYAAIRRDIKRPYWHGTLALAGEVLTRRVWADVCRFSLGEMGLDPKRHMFVAIIHEEQGKQHCHLLVCRVGTSGHVWSSTWDAYRLIELTQLIETKFGLRPTAGLSGRLADGTVPALATFPVARKVVHANFHAKKHGLRPVEPDKLWPRLLWCAEAATDEDHFIQLGRKVGIDIVRRAGPSGLVRGMSARDFDGDIPVGLFALTSGRMSLPKLRKMFESKRLARVESGDLGLNSISVANIEAARADQSLSYQLDESRQNSEPLQPFDFSNVARDFPESEADAPKNSAAEAGQALLEAGLDDEDLDECAQPSGDALLEDPESFALDEVFDEDQTKEPSIDHEDYRDGTADDDEGGRGRSDRGTDAEC